MKLKRILRRGVLLLLTVMLLCQVMPAMAAEIPSRNPLLNPQESGNYVQTEHEYINILLLGIDFGTTGYWGSGGKKVLEDCHTDAVLVASVDLTDQSVNLVSLPRDSVTYIPEVRGIYKLNASINCADTIEEGLERIRNAASWLLGGIEVHRYCAVDMNTMIQIGDAIGGVDFELEMSYTGHSGTKYKKGLQHLDGTGIMDYLRARTNATVNSNDIGRTGRQRELMSAIFQKLKENPLLAVKVLAIMNDSEQNFYTDMQDSDVTQLIQTILSMNIDEVGSYVLTGKYRTALEGWNFTFTDQENRQQVIKEAFGVDVDTIPYVSYDYCKWLVDYGFRGVKSITMGGKIKDYAATLETLTQEQETALAAFDEAWLAAISAFDDAADSQTNAQTNAMTTALKKMRTAGNTLAEKIGYPDKINWYGNRYWYADSDINEYYPRWQ